MRAKEVRSLLDARQNYARELRIDVTQDMLCDSFSDRLEFMLSSAAGGTCPVSLVYRQQHNLARVQLGERWQVIPSDELIQSLRDCVGSERVSLQYS